LIRFRCAIVFGFALMSFCGVCSAQLHDMLCKAGNGWFEAQSVTGVKVSVGAQKDGLLATRSCQASLSWGKQKLIIAEGTSQVDLDLFGADIGADGPVAAFVTPDSNAKCCVTYHIYSLQEPPHLLRTISGGGFFSAADTDLDGRVEIWTEDTAAVNGFERLQPGEIEFIPTYWQPTTSHLQQLLPNSSPSLNTSSPGVRPRQPGRAVLQHLRQLLIRERRPHEARYRHTRVLPA